MISPFGWVCRPTRTGYIYFEKYMFIAAAHGLRLTLRASSPSATLDSVACPRSLASMAGSLAFQRQGHAASVASRPVRFAVSQEITARVLSLFPNASALV